MNPDTDIVVTCHDHLDELRACIDSLYAHTSRFRLILVDDCSGAETAAYLRGESARSRSNLLIRTGYPRFWVRAANLGLRLARTPWAVLLNSDTVLGEGWLEELYRAVESSYLPVGLSGHVNRASCFGLEYKEGQIEETQKPTYVNGHCWLLNMHAMQIISEDRQHMYDGWWLNAMAPRLADGSGAVHYGADPDLCWELNDAGYATIAVFSETVQHHGPRPITAEWDADVTKRIPLSEIDDDYEGRIK
jgi:glycosyltransferase involved in cell wall biosynthesis